ncbi:DMT family transporter [Bacteroides sp. 214]|nr:DMT family transporter [Bacteroides sp. 214]
MNLKNLKAHLALLVAAAIWGLMAPVGKLAMDAGISNLSLAAMRMVGAAVCFWLVSPLGVKEQISKRDYLLIFFAALMSIVFNQGVFIFGLSLTTPVDASIITTFLPIITMILAALFLKEPITTTKALGVILGAIGAVMLILFSHGDAGTSGNIWGDLLVLVAQFSFACYLTIFKGLIARYHVITLMKWMFTYAAICFIPIAYNDLSITFNQDFPVEVWLQVGYVVLFGTFFAYILMVVGQKSLRPTIVSMYNYVQPIVGAGVSVFIGIGTFGWTKALASLLIFAGVYVVTQSKSREEIKA